MSRPNEQKFRHLDSLLAGARAVLVTAEACGLPAPTSVDDITVWSDQMQVHLAEREDAYAWAEWLGVLMIQVTPSLWHANGETLKQPVRVVWRDWTKVQGSADVAMVPLVGSTR